MRFQTFSSGSFTRSYPPCLPAVPVCANLVFYAVLRAERECVRTDFGAPGFIFSVAWAGVAQLVEHLICNQRVGGSNPFASSTLRIEDPGPEAAQ